MTRATPPVPPRDRPGPYAEVAVVTRTKDRPLLLARAARSIAQQTFRDFVWVVVNDGGDAGAAREATAQADLPAGQLVELSLQQSIGMEAAANRGVAAVGSGLIVVHDDDDSWHPDFLARTTAFLAAPRTAHYGGVTAIADYVSEEIVGGSVVEHARRPFNGDMRTIQLAEMLVRNQYPPISFLFRRSIWERAGGFNERLAVLGDWYFNIRFLLEADIGVLPERLAAWHHRDRGVNDEQIAAYANSVIATADLHAEYNAIVRHALMRELAGSHASMAPLIGFMIDDMRRETTALRHSIFPAEASGLDAASSARTLAYVTDIADRRWVMMQLPLQARLRLAALYGRRLRDPAWNEIAPLLTSVDLQPPADFDETAYRAANPDVDAGIQTGQISSGFAHYVRYGRLEGRRRQLRLAAPG